MVTNYTQPLAPLRHWPLESTCPVYDIAVPCFSRESPNRHGYHSNGKFAVLFSLTDDSRYEYRLAIFHSNYACFMISGCRHHSKRNIFICCYVLCCLEADKIWTSTNSFWENSHVVHMANTNTMQRRRQKVPSTARTNALNTLYLY
jgi:hypothetical protein